jgi:hypothetical protein
VPRGAVASRYYLECFERHRAEGVAPDKAGG